MNHALFASTRPESPNGSLFVQKIEVLLHPEKVHSTGPRRGGVEPPDYNIVSYRLFHGPSVDGHCTS